MGGTAVRIVRDLYAEIGAGEVARADEGYMDSNEGAKNPLQKQAKSLLSNEKGEGTPQTDQHLSQPTILSADDFGADDIRCDSEVAARTASGSFDQYFTSVISATSFTSEYADLSLIPNSYEVQT